MGKNPLPPLLLGISILLTRLVAHAHAANLLVEGGDFEAGLDGFGVTPVVMVRNWPSYVAPSIDSTTAGHGRRSLKLVNGSGQDVFEIHSRAFFLNNPHGDITLSFFAKSDSPQAHVDAAVCSGPQPIVNRVFDLSGQWTRYHFTLTPTRWVGLRDSDREGVPGTYYLRLTVPALTPWKTVWLDGIQVEPGPLTPYAAPNPVSLTFTVDREIAVYHPDETPKIILHAAGPNIAGQSVKIQIQELVSGDKDPAFSLSLNTDGDADHAQIAIPLSPRPRGCYRIVATTADGKITQSRGYGVIESMANRPASQRTFFGGSIETFQSATAFAADGIPVGPDDSLISSHYSPDAQFALAHDLGWGWWHAYWPYSCKVIEPHQNEFRWRDADTLADLARKHGLEILANLCAHGSSRQLPDWMKGSQISLGGMAMGKGDHLLDPTKYSDYAYALVQHFKNKIKLWEPWNEPGVKMRAAEYVPLLKAAYTGIKRADPNATVYGLCGTWDVDGDLYGWVRSCLRLGAGSFMDKISIHGYHVPERRYAAKVKQLARQVSGRDWAVADTEAGPYVSFQVYPQLVDAMFAEPPISLDDAIASMPRLYINELSNGVERGSWFNLTSYYAGIHYRDLVMLEYDGSPTPAMVAYNTVIDLLGPSKHYRSVPMGGDVAIEVFIDSQGKSLATLWADKSPQTLQIPLAAASTDLIDLLGRSQSPPSHAGGIELKLSKRPVFLRSANLSPDELAGALAKSVVPGLQELTISRSGLTRDPLSRPAIAVVLHGKTSHPLPGNVTISNSPWPLAKTAQPFKAIPLDESQILYFPLTQLPSPSGDSRIDLTTTLDTGAKYSLTWPLKIFSASRASHPIAVDGDLSDWNTPTFRHVSDWITAASAWDSAGVYFAFRCDDATPQPHVPKTQPWNSDSVELYFNPSIDHSYLNGNFYPGDAQIICPVPGLEDSSSSPTTTYRGQPVGSELNKSPRMKSENVRLAVRRFDGGYTMEIFVPWKNFPEDFIPRPENFMGFSFAVRDVDQKGVQRRRAIWAGDDTDFRNTSGYGILLLQP